MSDVGEVFSVRNPPTSPGLEKLAVKLSGVIAMNPLLRLALPRLCSIWLYTIRAGIRYFFPRLCQGLTACQVLTQGDSPQPSTPQQQTPR